MHIQIHKIFVLKINKYIRQVSPVEVQNSVGDIGKRVIPAHGAQLTINKRACMESDAARAQRQGPCVGKPASHERFSG